MISSPVALGRSMSGVVVTDASVVLICDAKQCDELTSLHEAHGQLNWRRQTLRFVYLNRCNLLSIATVPWVHSLRNMRVLDLSSNKLTHVGSATTWSHAFLLESLILDDNDLLGPTIVIEALALLPSLRALSTRANTNMTNTRSVMLDAFPALVALDGYIIADVERWGHTSYFPLSERFAPLGRRARLNTRRGPNYPSDDYTQVQSLDRRFADISPAAQVQKIWRGVLGRRLAQEKADEQLFLKQTRFNRGKRLSVHAGAVGFRSAAEALLIVKRAVRRWLKRRTLLIESIQESGVRSIVIRSSDVHVWSRMLKNLEPQRDTAKPTKFVASRRQSHAVPEAISPNSKEPSLGDLVTPLQQALSGSGGPKATEENTEVSQSADSEAIQQPSSDAFAAGSSPSRLEESKELSSSIPKFKTPEPLDAESIESAHGGSSSTASPLRSATSATSPLSSLPRRLSSSARVQSWTESAATNAAKSSSKFTASMRPLEFYSVLKLHPHLITDEKRLAPLPEVDASKAVVCWRRGLKNHSRVLGDDIRSLDLSAYCDFVMPEGERLAAVRKMVTLQHRSTHRMATTQLAVLTILDGELVGRLLHNANIYNSMRRGKTHLLYYLPDDVERMAAATAIQCWFRGTMVRRHLCSPFYVHKTNRIMYPAVDFYARRVQCWIRRIIARRRATFLRRLRDIATRVLRRAGGKATECAISSETLSQVFELSDQWPAGLTFLPEQEALLRGLLLQRYNPDAQPLRLEPGPANETFIQLREGVTLDPLSYETLPSFLKAQFTPAMKGTGTSWRCTPEDLLLEGAAVQYFSFPHGKRFDNRITKNLNQRDDDIISPRGMRKKERFAGYHHQERRGSEVVMFETPQWMLDQQREKEAKAAAEAEQRKANPAAYASRHRRSRTGSAMAEPPPLTQAVIRATIRRLVADHPDGHLVVAYGDTKETICRQLALVVLTFRFTDQSFLCFEPAAAIRQRVAAKRIGRWWMILRRMKRGGSRATTPASQQPPTMEMLEAAAAPLAPPTARIDQILGTEKGKESSLKGDAKMDFAADRRARQASAIMGRGAPRFKRPQPPEQPKAATFKAARRLKQQQARRNHGASQPTAVSTSVPPDPEVTALLDGVTKFPSGGHYLSQQCKRGTVSVLSTLPQRDTASVETDSGDECATEASSLDRGVAGSGLGIGKMTPSEMAENVASDVAADRRRRQEQKNELREARAQELAEKQLIATHNYASEREDGPRNPSTYRVPPQRRCENIRPASANRPRTNEEIVEMAGTDPAPRFLAPTPAEFTEAGVVPATVASVEVTRTRQHTQSFAKQHRGARPGLPPAMLYRVTIGTDDENEPIENVVASTTAVRNNDTRPVVIDTETVLPSSRGSVPLEDNPMERLQSEIASEKAARHRVHEENAARREGVLQQSRLLENYRYATERQHILDRKAQQEDVESERLHDVTMRREEGKSRQLHIKAKQEAARHSHRPQSATRPQPRKPPLDNKWSRLARPFSARARISAENRVTVAALKSESENRRGQRRDIEDEVLSQWSAVGSQPMQPIVAPPADFGNNEVGRQTPHSRLGGW